MSEDNATTTAPHERMVMLPCPFCGGPAQIVELPHSSSPSTFNIACGTEDEQGCPLVFYGDRETRDEMVAKWNRRDGNPCRNGCMIDRAVEEFCEDTTSD